MECIIRVEAEMGGKESLQNLCIHCVVRTVAGANSLAGLWNGPSMGFFSPCLPKGDVVKAYA